MKWKNLHVDKVIKKGETIRRYLRSFKNPPQNIPPFFSILLPRFLYKTIRCLSPSFMGPPIYLNFNYSHYEPFHSCNALPSLLPFSFRRANQSTTRPLSLTTAPLQIHFFLSSSPTFFFFSFARRISHRFQFIFNREGQLFLSVRAALGCW
jgi:hypothetical protein